MMHQSRIRTTIPSGVCLAVLLGLSASAAAMPVLDQAYDTPIGSSHYTGGIAGYQWQQGVTAGLGGLLTSVDLYFFQSGTTRVFVNLGAPWQTDADDFSVDFTVPAAGWNSIDVSGAGIDLAPGDVFSIGIEGLGTTTTWPSFAGSHNDGTYAGGALYFNGTGYTNGSLNNDMNFRTYVDTAVVPLPASLPLLGTGLALLGLGGGRRRTRKIS